MAEYESIARTAERLDVTRETIRLWIHAGHFPGAIQSGPGGAHRIPRDAAPDFTGKTRKTTRPRRTTRRVTSR